MARSSKSAATETHSLVVVLENELRLLRKQVEQLAARVGRLDTRADGVPLHQRLEEAVAEWQQPSSGSVHLCDTNKGRDCKICQGKKNKKKGKKAG